MSLAFPMVHLQAMRSQYTSVVVCTSALQWSKVGQAYRHMQTGIIKQNHPIDTYLHPASETWAWIYLNMSLHGVESLLKILV